MDALSSLGCLLVALLPVTQGQEAEAAWAAVEAAAPDAPVRSEALREALRLQDGPLEGPRLQLAWTVGVEASRALRLDEAIEIQTYLEHWHPADWSSMDLALSLGKSGRTEEADGVLARAIAREGAQGRFVGELWNRRGLLALGNNDERSARNHLGRALARGSGDAAVVLARLDLREGSFQTARAGFRSRLYDVPPGAWAQRGWGLSMLRPSSSPEPNPASTETKESIR